MNFYRSVKYFTYIEKKTYVAELYVYIDFRLVWILNFLLVELHQEAGDPPFWTFQEYYWRLVTSAL